MLTAEQLRQIMPRLPAPKLQEYLPFLNDAMQRFAVNTRLRTAAFVAQLAHESAEFRFMEEIWGPTAAQLRYEPPSDVARRLGNTEAGDGRRFKGRGPIQITGRFNYQKYGTLLGADLIAQPERAATPAVGFATAGLYWLSNHLNELADAEDFVGITRRINGGTTGLPSRRQYYERAKTVLDGTFVADTAVRSRGLGRAAQAPPLPPNLEPLTRGREAVVAARVPRSAPAKAAPSAPKKKATAGTRTSRPTPKARPVRKKAAASTKKTAARRKVAKKSVATTRRRKG